MHKMAKIITILAAFVVAIFTVDRLPQFAAIGMLSASGVYFISKKIPKDNRNIVIILFLAVLFIQIFIALFLYNDTVHTKYYGFSYKGDDYVYGDFGTIVGALWRQGTFLSLKQLTYYNLIGKFTRVELYQLYNAFIFYLFGVCGGQILLIINCFFHAAIIIPVYFILRDLKIKTKVINFIFCLFLFWPSTFYWSLFNLKEPMLLFALFCVFAFAIKMTKSPRSIFLVYILLLLSLLYLSRNYIFFIVLAALGIHFFLEYKWTLFRAAILSVISFLFILRQAFVKPALFSNLYAAISKLPLMIFGSRYAARVSNTPYFAEFLLVTFGRVIAYFPIGLVSVMILPFLLRPFSLSHIATNTESVIWWCLLPLLFQGIYYAFKKDLCMLARPMLIVFFVWFALLAITSSNMGTLLRHKAILYYVGFIFIAIAIDRILKLKETSNDGYR